jgi:uncharacterized iron-regulated membrane protein
MYFFDQKNGKLLHTEKLGNLNKGQIIRNMYYDIHIGKILGFPTQLAVFFASLIVASLHVTGFYIWWGRNNKKKTK